MGSGPSGEVPKTNEGPNEKEAAAVGSGPSTQANKAPGPRSPDAARREASRTEGTGDIDDEAEDEAELTDRDRVLARAVARGLTHAAAGERVGVSAKTAARLGDPRFAAAVAGERRQIFEEIGDQLSNASFEAVRTVVNIMRSDEPAEQLKEAQVVLNLGSRYHRQVVDHDIEHRLDRIEQVLGANQDLWPGTGPLRGESS